MKYVVNDAKKRKGQNYINWTNTYRHSLKTGGKCMTPKEGLLPNGLMVMFIFFFSVSSRVDKEKDIFSFQIVKVYLLL